MPINFLIFLSNFNINKINLLFLHIGQGKFLILKLCEQFLQQQECLQGK